MDLIIIFIVGLLAVLLALIVLIALICIPLFIIKATWNIYFLPRRP